MAEEVGPDTVSSNLSIYCHLEIYNLDVSGYRCTHYIGNANVSCVGRHL